MASVMSPHSGTFDVEFRQVLGTFPTGVAIVTALLDGAPTGMTIQSFSSLSLDPPMVLLCPAHSSTSWPKIAAARELVVNVLADDQGELARQFARTGTDKFAGVSWEPAPTTGAPIVAGSLAWIECELGETFPGGDHLIAVCRVRTLSARSHGDPLVFYRSSFRALEGL
jgi:flavin reductase (DIM6/NTAB) family NADH-FMN oxidoreductase RutF